MNTYTKKERNMYLIGLMGQNIIYNIIGTGMAFYFQSVICLPAIAISIIMGVARVWDAINDPMMGTIVDRTRTKYGKCRPYLFVVPGIIMVTTILTFVNGIYSESNTFTTNAFIIGWAGISYIMWGMTYTAGDIPIWGITALMTESERDRSKLLGDARIVGGIGTLIVMLAMLPVSQAVGNMFIDRGMEEAKGVQYGFILVAVVLTVVGTIAFQCSAYAKERVKQPSDEAKGFVDNVRIMWGCMPFRRILISGIIKAPMQILGLVAMTLLSYYYGDNGGDGQNYMPYMLMLGGPMFIGQFVAMAVVPRICANMEKRKVYNVTSVVGAIPFILLFIVYLIDGTSLYKWYWIAIMAVFFAIAGAAVGASSVIQSIMIADCVDYDEHRTGYRPDAVFFSGQSFITKLGAGVSSFIQGIVFAAVGFSGDAVKACNAQLLASPKEDFLFATAPEFEPYRFGMFFLITIPAAITCLISVLPMKNYEITNESLQNILTELNEKRNTEAK